MQQSNDNLIGFIIAIGMHAALLLIFFLSGLISSTAVLPEAKGEPVQASVMISAADIKRAEKSIRESEAAPPPKPSQAVQPTPEPRPQTAETPQQMQAQAPVINPDTQDQQRINKLAVQQSDEKIVAEQEARRRQAQIDLTEEIKKQEQAENKQRLREQQLAQLEAIRLAQKAAATRTRMEDQRLQQLQDLQQNEPVRAPAGPPVRTSGNPSANNDLKARYMAAIKATIHQNWRHNGAEPLQRCQVEFTQAPGGEVIDVTFVSCPFSPEGRESAERAVRLTPLPYYGFEPVFERRQSFTLCYPIEQCEK
ncbi:MAG: cell envelope integrity protein TolA [Arenimonas sp.]